MKPLAELLARHPLPNPEGGKDEKGTIVVVGGPPTCPGAALLTGTSALRAGSGRVQLCVDPAVTTALGVALPEAAVFGWDLHTAMPRDVADALGTADVVVVGVGHTHVPGDAVRAIAARTDAPLVLDAGALHAAGDVATSHALVIAPNAHEAAQLLDDDTTDDEGHLARALQLRFGQPVAVRGAIAAVADADDVWCYDELPPGLGTPGSGDVFVGVLATLIGNGCASDAALAWAVELHAGAARRLATDTPVGYLASDVARELPAALSRATANLR